MRLVAKLLAPFQTAFKQSLETFIRLETADDEITLASSDGSLVTVVRVDGSRQIIGEEEYNFLVEGSTIKIGSRFDRQGHAMQVYFVRDPNRITRYLEDLLRPSRLTAEACELDVKDVFDERVRHLSRYLSYEECYYVLWTRPSILTKNELKRASQESRKKKWIRAGYAQNPLAALDALRTRHRSYTASVLSSLDELGIRAEVMQVHDALRAIKNNLYPTKSHEDWRACLPGDVIPPRAPLNRADLSDIVWPTIRQQLALADSYVLNESIVRIGDLIWGGADVTLAPMDPSPFPMLLNRLFEAKVPYRISFLIEGGGVYATQFRAFAATILGVTNAVNKQIKFSLEGLQRLARKEPVVRMRISLATWAPRDNLRLLQDRLSNLIQAVESWGYCQVSEFSGDPLECVMASALGIHCAGTAPAAVAPMFEVMKLMPWQRPSSPFHRGSMLFRTPDGKVWPYQTGTNVTTTWFDLIFAQPGAGKSVLLNSTNIATCLTPGLSQLPYVAIIDIGPSSSGMISLIKEALPEYKQHEATSYRLQMTQQYAVNPFDTQLGCRAPMIDERSYLVELLTLLCTPPGMDRPYDGIQQLCGLVVDEMFRWRDDTAANAEPRPYLPRLDHDVDEAIAKHNLHLPSDPYWWDVVDRMFDLGETHIAMLAQRHAVPTLSDAIVASRRPQIRALLEETGIGLTTETVINAFERMITSSIREFPILAGITRFDVSDSRVCSLDLMDVSPQGDDSADRQTSIMYMLARHVLVRSWWVGMEMIEHMPEKYRMYHELRLQNIIETPKRLCYDEFHRTSKSRSVRAQVVRDVREGRKRGVQIALSSQLLDDFDSDMVDLATGVWVLGAAISDQAVDNIRERFGLSQTARNIIRYKLTGPRAGGAPALFVLGTVEGKYEQHLLNTLGPIELWALSTSAEDVAIRNRLYQKLGAGRARQMLAVNFPGGSARGEIKRRVMMLAEKGEVRSAAVSQVVQEIVNELIEASTSRLDKNPDEESPA
ncbi:MAG: type IV secretion protein IcmB [Micavibrio aeruginosavorus]|uniref:Type IV secretion protein IcmB n=1 Tax=Micavibrio aeruginosavorus TaxID=349221 RepID=A0A2W5N6M6_9BACT|nr:MAG: type IV secretion protein IcmB [Micavibrio aeruginosavorus]